MTGVQCTGEHLEQVNQPIATRPRENSKDKMSHISHVISKDKYPQKFSKNAAFSSENNTTKTG